MQHVENWEVQGGAEVEYSKTRGSGIGWLKRDIFSYVSLCYPEGGEETRGISRESWDFSLKKSLEDKDEQQWVWAFRGEDTLN